MFGRSVLLSNAFEEQKENSRKNSLNELKLLQCVHNEFYFIEMKEIYYIPFFCDDGHISLAQHTFRSMAEMRTQRKTLCVSSECFLNIRENVII